MRNMVRGGMTATMATLLDLSNILVSPWKWYPAENPNVDWTYSGGLFFVKCNRDFPTRFGSRRLCLGAENGVDMTILHKHHKQLVARGAHVRAGMLYKIATAQIYDGSRVCEHDPDAQVACVLCGSPDDSMFHRVYDCPCIPTSSELDKTYRIVDEARTKAHSCPIFWFRGLPPRGWYLELPVADDPLVEDFGPLHIMGGHVFTDGSGRAETKDPRLRRCGYGVAWVFSDGVLLNTLGGRAGILHGRNQSVARAELLAAVKALRLARRATQQVVIWTHLDRLYVCDQRFRQRKTKETLVPRRPMGRILESSRRHWTPSLVPKSGEVTPLRRRLPQVSFYHWKHTVTKLQTNLPREEPCGKPSPCSTLLLRATLTVE